MSEFKIKLLTSRVSAIESLAAGDKITVGNDEAWLMVNNGLGELVKGQKTPAKPKFIEAQEKAVERKLKESQKTLRAVHAEGEELEEQRLKFEGQIKRAFNLVGEKESQLASLGLEYSDLQQAFDEMQSANEFLQREFDSLKDELKVTLARGEAISSDLEKANGLISELEKELKADLVKAQNSANSEVSEVSKNTEKVDEQG